MKTETLRRQIQTRVKNRYPGNINVLCVSIHSYITTLQHTQGSVPEFINPKYANNDNTGFQSPSRLECMMQDLPKIMHSAMKVGYCSLPRWICFSAAKNSYDNALLQERNTGYGESIFSMEEDYYKLFRKVLQPYIHFPPTIANHDKLSTRVQGTPSTPIIVLSPNAALSITEMKRCFSGQIELSENAVLYINKPNVHLHDVQIEGAMVIQESHKQVSCNYDHQKPEKAKGNKKEENKPTIYRNIQVKNRGWSFVFSQENHLRKYTFYYSNFNIAILF